MSEKTHLNAEQKAEQIKAVKAIAELLPKIQEQIKNLHAKACIVAFQNSVDNLTKKCEIYNKEKEELTAEEKEIVKAAQEKALQEFRAQKKNDEISADTTNSTTETNEPIPEISEEKISEVKHENKKKGRR